MDGKALITALLQHTGLPQEGLAEEVDRLIQKHGLNKEHISLEDLRLVMEDYLHSVLPEAQQSFRNSS